MHRYFKLVCTADDAEWYLQEFLNGRVRFGWSWPGLDLRIIKQKDWSARTERERLSWKYTKFLLERIEAGDRLAIQTEQPLRRFLVAEVVPPSYDFAPGDLPDFNHLLHVKPLTPRPIPINSKEVSVSLKHDLSKRGQYYEIYPEGSIRELDKIVSKVATTRFNWEATRTDGDTLDRTQDIVTQKITEEISRNWPAKEFEKFCAMLCETVDFIEVKDASDRFKGWDLLVRINNPLTGTIVLDDVPVQCKNFRGLVSSLQPIDDLERAVRNSGSHVAYLFIMGELSDDFRRRLAEREEALSAELGRQVYFEVVEEGRIAELYVKLLSDSVGTRGGINEPKPQSEVHV